MKRHLPLSRSVVRLFALWAVPLWSSAALGATAASGTIYVATNGNDAWSGSVVSPNAGKTDGPVATLPRALDAIRQWREHQPNPDKTTPAILIGPGVYSLTQPLILKPADSGLTIASATKQKPVLSGGRRITGWKVAQREGKSLWAAEVPQVQKNKWYFRELWVNGRRATRARHPNQGYLKVAGLLDSAKDWTHGQSEFQYAPADLKSWATITNAEVVVMNRWADSRLPILSINEEKHTITFSKRSVFALEKDDLYYVEGVFEALDQPGEWYLERQTATLYYQPRPGESLNNLEVYAPALVQVVRLEGQPDQDQFVTDVIFRGIEFSHTEWCFPDGFAEGKNKPEISPAPEAQVGGFGQAEVGVPGAVWGEGVRNCRFEDCAFDNLGNYALELGRGCQNNNIAQCEFSQLGAGGLKLGETAIRQGASEMTRGNTVSDCSIHDGGLMFHSAIGVWIGQSPDNQLLHNEIHDFYYTGISIGWTWGYGPALASNNVVAFNHVHHIGVKSDGDGPILSDMGGIYTLGKQPGSQVLNNLWHDIAGLRYGGWGIYFDEGSSGIVATSNIVYNTTHGGFHQHYGETNRVFNNIFAFGRDQQLQRTRVEPHVSFAFQTNIVFYDSGNLLAGDWSHDKYEMDWNVYFDRRIGANPEQMKFEKGNLQEWRARGHDLHSIIADPLFIEPDKFNFGLQAQSPALRLGFEPIDATKVGVRKPSEH